MWFVQYQRYQLSGPLVTGIKFLPWEESSCHREKIPATGIKFLLQDEHSCNRKKISTTGRKFLPHEENSCGRNKNGIN
jgi:hypothetical protein